MEKTKHRHGRSGRTYENKKRKMKQLYESNDNIQKKYKSLDEFIALLKKPSPAR